ncbi:MAG: cyanophycinase [Bryobacteraceae bacterium]
MCAKLLLVFIAILFISVSSIGEERSSGPVQGTLIVDGGGTTQPVVNEFVKLAGGPGAKIVVIPTGASSLRFGPDKVILNPDWPRSRPEWRAYEEYLQKLFGVSRVTVVHTRDRTANSVSFVEPLRQATGVFLGTGNAGRHAAAYLGTKTQSALQSLLDRGGVLFGSSAGAIILGSFTVRGRPDKPLLMALGHEQGFGFLRNVAIDPHLTQAKRDNELVDVTDAHPELLGIGIDEDAALVVRHNTFEVIGTGRVAIYDNSPHEGAWYYWLGPHNSFDLATWKKLP